MLWTAMPLELVVEQEPPYELHEMEIDGVRVLVEVREAGECRIRQIISANAAAFLDPRFAPGTAVEWKPTLK
ncbi:MAG: YlzJ-like family protein [Bacillota bacterium]